MKKPMRRSAFAAATNRLWPGVSLALLRPDAGAGALQGIEPGDEKVFPRRTFCGILYLQCAAIDVSGSAVTGSDASWEGFKRATGARPGAAERSRCSCMRISIRGFSHARTSLLNRDYGSIISDLYAKEAALWTISHALSD